MDAGQQTEDFTAGSKPIDEVCCLFPCARVLAKTWRHSLHHDSKEAATLRSLGTDGSLLRSRIGASRYWIQSTFARSLSGGSGCSRQACSRHGRPLCHRKNK